MTFTVTTTREPCSFPAIVTLSGPVLTYGLAWFGIFLLRSPKYTLLAYTLIFASFAHLRFIQTLTGRGDELILAEGWFGISSGLIVAAIVFLIGLPPVIAAFESLRTDGAHSFSLARGCFPYLSYLQCFLEMSFFLGPTVMKSKVHHY